MTPKVIDDFTSSAYRCSTQVDSNGVHVGKILAWGHCDMTNPVCRGEDTGE